MKDRHPFIPDTMRRIGWVIGGIILAVFMAFIFGYFVMLLWNWLMPALFGLPVITYWMGFGIIVLARLIFGGFGHHGHPENYHHNRFYNAKYRKCRPRFGGANKWQYYEDYWREEGEQAFERFVEKKNSTAENENPAI